MTKSKKVNTLQKSLKKTSPIYVLALYGCGGTDGSSSENGDNLTSSLARVFGTVVKGPLQGARVFLDADNNGELGEGEEWVVTGDDGTFVFAQGNPNLPLVALTDGAIDLSSGTSIGNVTLKAEAGSSVVTPITTLIVETGLTATQIAEALDLPENVSYSSFNPYASGVDNNVAVAVENAGHKVISTITTFANVLQNNSTLTQEAALAEATAAMTALIQEKSSGSGVVDLSTAAGVAEYTNKLEAAAGVTFPEVVRSAANEGIAAVNAEIDKLEFIAVEGATGSTTTTPTGYSTQVYALVEDLRTQAANNTITFNAQTDFVKEIGDEAPSNIELATYKFDGTHDLISAPILSTDGKVGTFKTTDVLSTFETDTETAFSYALSGADGSKFQIINSQQLIYAFDPTADAQKSYNIIVTSTDEGGKWYKQEITVKDHPVASMLGKVNLNQWDVSVAASPHIESPVAWAGSTSLNTQGKILFKVPSPSTNNDVFYAFSKSYFSETNPKILWLAPPEATDGKLIISGDIKAIASAPTQISFRVQDFSNDPNASQKLGDYAYAKIVVVPNKESLIKLATTDSEGRPAPDYSDVLIKVADPNVAGDFTDVGVTDAGFFADGVTVPQSNIRYSVNAITSNGPISVTVTASSAYTTEQSTEFVIDNRIETYRSAEKVVILSDRYYSAAEVAADTSGTLTTDTVKTSASDTFLISDYAVNGYFSDGITVSEANITPDLLDPAANGQVSVVLTGKWIESVEEVNQYGNQTLGLTDNTFVVAWTQKSLSGQDCYGQIFNDSGNSISKQFLISAQPYNTASQVISLTEEASAAFSTDAFTGIGSFADGVVVDAENISYIKSDPDANGNISATLKAAWASNTNVTEHSPNLSLLGSDKFIISWIEETDSSTNIKAKIYNTDGTVSVPQFDINVNSNSDLGIAQKINYHPVIQETTDGFICVWLSYDELGDSPSMMARSFDLEGLPNGQELASNVLFSTSYSEYNNVNDVINLIATVDDPDAGTAITLTMNSGAIATLARDSTSSTSFTGSYKIGINDRSVPALLVEEAVLNTNQRLLYSKNTQQDKYGNIFKTDVYGDTIEKSYSFDVSLDSAFSVQASGDKVAVVYSAVSDGIQNSGAHEIFMSGFDLSDSNWADTFENSLTLLSDAGLTQLNTRPDAIIRDVSEEEIKLSTAWEARPVLTAADTFNFEVMSQIYSKSALNEFTKGRFVGDDGLREYMKSNDFSNLNYDFQPYKKLVFADKLSLVDQTKLDAYLLSFGTDIYEMEANLETIALPVAGFSQTGHSYDEVTGELKLKGTDLFTLLGEGLDALTAEQFDWSKLYWDIDGTGANRVQFDPSTDIDTVTLLPDLFTVKLSEDLIDENGSITQRGGQTKLLETPNFGGNILVNSGIISLGLADKLDINAGFLKDATGFIVIERSIVLENGSVELANKISPTLAKFEASPDDPLTGTTGSQYKLTATFETDGNADQMRSGTQFKANLQDGTEVLLTQTDETPLNTFTGTFIIAAGVGQTWQEGITSYENVSAVDISGNALAPNTTNIKAITEKYFIDENKNNLKDGVETAIDDTNIIFVLNDNGFSKPAVEHTFSDFKIGQDVLGMFGTMRYTDLAIYDSTPDDENSGDTIISQGSEILAILTGIDDGLISEADFGTYFQEIEYLIPLDIL